MKNLIFIFLVLSSLEIFSQNFSLPKLNYNYNSLERAVDAQTMEIHHSKHHQAYVNNLNKSLIGSGLENKTIIEILINISSANEFLKNNAGGHYNHSLFWEVLTPKENTKPSYELEKAINNEFGNLDSLKKIINTFASTKFGSGWAWLIVTPDKKLKVTSTSNQDNPLMDIVKDRGIPILAIDVWEHAYYLKYQNKRNDYLDAIWSIIDWGSVSTKYSEALNNPLLEHL